MGPVAAAEPMNDKLRELPPEDALAKIADCRKRAMALIASAMSARPTKRYDSFRCVAGLGFAGVCGAGTIP